MLVDIRCTTAPLLKKILGETLVSQIAVLSHKHETKRKKRRWNEKLLPSRSSVWNCDTQSGKRKVTECRETTWQAHSQSPIWMRAMRDSGLGWGIGVLVVTCNRKAHATRNHYRNLTPADICRPTPSTPCLGAGKTSLCRCHPDRLSHRAQGENRQGASPPPPPPLQGKQYENKNTQRLLYCKNTL